MSDTREQKATSYCDGQGEFKALSLGRLRIGRKAIAQAEHLEEEEEEAAMISVAAALYLMDFQQLRAIPSALLLERMQEFSDPIPLNPTGVQALAAFKNDIEALQLSQMSSPEGKDQAEAPNHSEKPLSEQQLSASDIPETTSSNTPHSSRSYKPSMPIPIQQPEATERTEPSSNGLTMKTDPLTACGNMPLKPSTI